MHGVLEFANVAEPGGRLDALTRSIRQAAGEAVGGRVLLDEVVGQREQVVRALAQRRDVKVHHVEAVEQVLPELAANDRFLQDAVRRGDDADIDLHRLRAADAVDLAFLDGAQQLGLKPDIHFRYLVQQQRAAVGFLELADAARDGAGERALLVAEQFATRAGSPGSRRS